MNKLLLTFVATFCCYASQVFAGSMTAELDRTRVDIGESAQLAVTISGSLKDDISLPQVPGLNFQQMGTSTNVQIVNGSFSKETTYTFAVNADHAGTFQIPSIKATIDKEEVATAPLTVTFGGAGSTPQGSAQSPPSGNTAQSGQNTQGNEPPPIFIERELSNQNPYEGQAILSTVRIFARVRVTSMVPERDSSPAWRVISQSGQKNYETMRDNARWHVIEINEVIVPLKAGALAPPSFALQTTYIQPTKQRIRRGSIWDLLQGSMDMGQEVSKKIASESKPIQVRPLPSEGRPAVVSDMVGDFKVSVDVSKRNLNSGETSTVSVKVSGRGALDRMADIKLPTLVGAKIYPDKPQLKESIDESGLKSSKEYKFAIVPSQVGEQRLGSIELGVFNPATAKWYSLKEDLGVLTVAGAAGNTAPQNPLPGGPEPTVVATPDTNHNQLNSSPTPIEINPANELGSTDRSNPLKWFGIAILLLGLLAVAIFAKPLQKRYRSWSETKSVAKTPYGLLTTYIGKSADDPQILFAALQKVTAGQDQDPKSMTAQDMRRALDLKGVPPRLAEKIQHSLDEIESSTYRGTVLSKEILATFAADLRELAAWESA